MPEPVLKIGLLTDVHYAEAEPRIGRYYRESLSKMREAAAWLNAEGVDLAIELGDLIDTPDPPDPTTELEFLRAITEEFRRINAPHHYVLGNHCVSALTKEQFLQTVEQERSFYSFDHNGVHCILLDGCFREDGAAYTPGTFAWTDSDLPIAQREWLAADLAATTNPTVVFVHQRLDDAPMGYGIHSRTMVRTILEASGKVIAVLQGHSHKNELQTIAGIPYITLAAMIEGSGLENSGASILNISVDATFTLTGFRRHANHPVIGVSPSPRPS
jgi:predicted phosphodiesterase